MGNTEISDTDTDTGGNGTQSPLSPLFCPPLNPYAVYYILYTVYRIPNPESCIPNPTAQFAQLCDDNGKHFYCVSTSLSVLLLLLFCLVPFFVALFCCCSICCADCCCCCTEYLYLLQVFVCRFTASISIFGPSSAAGQQRRNPFLSPLTRSCFYTLQWIV